MKDKQITIETYETEPERKMYEGDVPFIFKLGMIIIIIIIMIIIALFTGWLQG